MLVWLIGSPMVIVGSLRLFWPYHVPDLIDLLLLPGGWGMIIVNEIIFSLRKEQLEIDRDETIKGTGEKLRLSPMILAICPQCKSRIPSDSKYCLECGADLSRAEVERLEKIRDE